MHPHWNTLISSLHRPPDYGDYTIEQRNILLSDGTVLLADIALPVGAALPLPTIVCRTPYGRNGSPFFFELSLFGYACVLNHCRGTHGSGGDWAPFVHELSDGEEVLSWTEAQDFCNGSIGMTGFSYMAMCQWLMAEHPPKALKCLDIEAYNPYRNSQLYTNGMFRLEAYTGWTVYNTGLSSLPDSPHALYPKALSFLPPNEMDEAVFGKKLPWYQEWLRHPNLSDGYWHQGVWKVLENLPPKTHLPLCIRVGWYDTHLQGMLDAYEALPETTKMQSLLLLPPCNHKGAVAGETNAAHAYDIVGPRYFDCKLSWFDHHLQGRSLPNQLTLGGANAYVYGEDCWTSYPSFPPLVTEKPLYLSPEGLIHKVPKQGHLSYCYNPSQPVPSQGSEDIMIDYIYQADKPSANGRLRLSQEKRQDILTFLSPVFPEDLQLCGRIQAKLFVSSTAEDTAFTVKLSEVLPNGDALHLRDGITTLRFPHGKETDYTPNTIVAAALSCPFVAFTLKQGRRLRLDISSSNFPAFHIHPNTKTLWADEVQPISATQTLYFGGDTPSALLLPIKEETI